MIYLLKILLQKWKGTLVKCDLQISFIGVAWFSNTWKLYLWRIRQHAEFVSYSTCNLYAGTCVSFGWGSSHASLATPALRTQLCVSRTMPAYCACLRHFWNRLHSWSFSFTSCCYSLATSTGSKVMAQSYQNGIELVWISHTYNAQRRFSNLQVLWTWLFSNTHVAIKLEHS